MARRTPVNARRQSGPFNDGVVIKLLLLQLASLCVTEVSCQNVTDSLPGANTTSAHASPSANTTAALPPWSSTTPSFTFPVGTTKTTTPSTPSTNTTATDSKVAATSTAGREPVATTAKAATTEAVAMTTMTVAMTTMTTAGLSTPAVDVVVTSVRPVYGPIAGGTRVTITAQGLNASTIVAVHFGQHRAVDFSVEGDSLIAMTPPVSDTAQNLAIAIEFVSHSTPIDTGFMFDYRPNPTVTGIGPRSHHLGGGTVLTVTGDNLNSVAEPRLILTTVITYLNGTNTTSHVNVTRTFYSKPCQFPTSDGSSMTCVIPRFVRDEVVKGIDPDNTGWSGTDGPGVAAYIETDGSRRTDIFVGLQFDGYKRYQNISDEFPKMEFKFPPPPTVTCPSDVIEVDPDEDTVISIEGEHLNRGSRQEDFRITIGDGECVVTELTEDRVDCKPPSMKPNKKDDDTHCDGETMTLEVMIGNVHHECSCVRYLSPDDDDDDDDDDDVDLGMIIGVCIVVFIVTLFVIFLIFVLVECVFCGRRQAKSVEPDDQNL